ncbi:MAG: DUF998 domain-containing protein [Candidatus Odinarchaeia archaeon]
MLKEKYSKHMFWFGIIGPLWAIISIAVSISLSPWFSWTNNALSDLGVSSVAIIFNSGLIVCGLFAAVFTIVFAKSEGRNLIETVGCIILFASCISLIGIGVFSEAFGVIHFYVSVLFFVLFLLAALVLGIRFILDNETRWFGVYSICVTVIGILGWVFLNFPGVAIPEAVTAFPGAIWLIILSGKIYRKRVYSRG